MWLRDVDNKNIRLDIFLKLSNVVLEKNGEDIIGRECMSN